MQIVPLGPRRLYRSTLGIAVTVVVVTASAVACPPLPPSRDSERIAFTAENAAAMHTMMASMAITPSGDVDRDFVAMMVPHHQGAIDMARAELRYGRNEQLRRLAQEIIVTQQQEIVTMRLVVGQAPPSSAPSTASCAEMPE
jgi:Domain of unknown function (DUF305)